MHPGTAQLLAAVPEAVDAVAVYVYDQHGGLEAQFGGGDSVPPTDGAGPEIGRQQLQLPLPGGGRVRATFPAGVAGLASLLESLLTGLCEREQLELDMDSMNCSSLQLLEQVAMLNDTLPRLSAGESDAEVAALGARACLVAAGVERVVFLRYHAETDRCDVLVHMVADEDGKAVAAPYPGDERIAADCPLLAALFAAEDHAVLRTVVEQRNALPEGSLEGLARHQLIGAPVSYGSGDKRVRIGALLAFDKRQNGFSTYDLLGSQEGQVLVSFASMLGAVLGARKTAELGKELAMAHAIQAQILPDRPAVVGGFDLAADYRACGEVGGDYFDYVRLADGRTLVVVADVSGHNLASGMMMVGARATLRSLAAVHADPARLFGAFAAAVYDDLTRTERFITAAAVVLRDRDPRVEYVSAGHADLLVFRAATGEVERVPSEGTILGFLPQPSYRSQSLSLQPADTLLLYTDGLTETTDPNGDMFGDERLERAFAAAARRSGARRVVDGVLAAVQQFRGESQRGDDVTALAVQADPGSRSES